VQHEIGSFGEGIDYRADFYNVLLDIT
jgi:hypothetical protein